MYVVVWSALHSRSVLSERTTFARGAASSGRPRAVEAPTHTAEPSRGIGLKGRGRDPGLVIHESLGLRIPSILVSRPVLAIGHIWR